MNDFFTLTTTAGIAHLQLNRPERLNTMEPKFFPALRDAVRALVVVIEHNLDVVACADWVIDLGPEGGEGGGRIVAQGPPEVVARTKKSYTGQALSRVLGISNNGHHNGNAK